MATNNSTTANPPAKTNATNKSYTYIIIIVVVLAIIAIAIFVWWYFWRRKADPSPNPSPDNNPPSVACLYSTTNPLGLTTDKVKPCSAGYTCTIDNVCKVATST